MAAANAYDFLEDFLGPILEDGEKYDTFSLSKTDFMGWLRVLVMYVSFNNPNNKDINKFAKEYKSKFIDVVENKSKS